MNKVVTIHLDGIAYQLEEAAYDALRAYLDAANAKLNSNPDKDEIVKDLEQAIGAKLHAYLSAHKNVVTAADVSMVIEEMGPVAAEGETTSAGDGSEGASSATPVHKRLYRIREGEWIAGVCTGLAAYFTVDVSLVRILFVLLVALSHGLGGLAYIVLWIVVPIARTPKEYAYASGTMPVTAQELVDRARKSVEDFANSDEWSYWKNNWKEESKKWKAQSKSWKHQGKAWRHAQKQQWKAARNHRYDYNTGYGQPQSFLSELNGFIWSMFGLLVTLFALWYLYHHVHIIQQFIDFAHATWNSFFDVLARATGNT